MRKSTIDIGAWFSFSIASMLILSALLTGCASPSAEMIERSTQPIASPKASKNTEIKTILLCKVMEEPAQNFGGVPHDSPGSGEPFADTYRMMSPVSIVHVYKGSPELKWFSLGYVEGETNYRIATGEEYFILMTEASPYEAFMGFDGVYNVADGLLEAISGTGIPPSIDGLTVEQALQALGIMPDKQ